MNEISADFETKSDVDLKICGAYRYMESPHFVPLMAYFFWSGEYHYWEWPQDCPGPLTEHIRSGGLIRAFSASFERGVFNWLSRNAGWPQPRIEQYRCTAVQGAAMGLPRKLEKIGDALDISMKKDRRGAALIRLFCVPKSSDPPIFNDKTTHPAEWEEFKAYCKRDVEAEREVASRLAPLSDYEWRVYALNERINDKGLRIDVASARAALKLIEKAKASLDAEIHEITGGAVAAASQVGRLKVWLLGQGVEASKLGKDDIDELMLDSLPDAARQALSVRQEAAKSSTAKIAGMLRGMCADGRVRGAYLHHGAGQTGRFSSRGSVQFHNLARPRKIFEDSHVDLSVLFEAIRTEEPAALKLIFGDELGRPLHLISDAVRSFIWAAPGREMLVVDYASIEGRIAAWIAKEHWKVEAYRALDRGEGHGIYELTAAGIYGIPVAAVGKMERQTGKVAELSLGYAGGAGAISRFARQNKVALAPLHDPLCAAAEPEVLAYARKRFVERTNAHDATAASLGEQGWIAAELIKLGWRAKHPAITTAWKSLQEAAVAAVETPGTQHAALGASFLVRFDFLWMRLPSGRCLAYGKPRMQQIEAPWADPTLPPEKREKMRSLTARSVDPTTETWKRFPLYGGAFFANLVSGLARDILVDGMLRAEPIYGTPSLHTHDEIGVEVPRGTDVAAFEALLCKLPEWCDGLPMAAAGWAGKRYRK